AEAFLAAGIPRPASRINVRFHPKRTSASPPNNFPTGAHLCSTLADGAAELHPRPLARTPRRLERRRPAEIHRPPRPRPFGRRSGQVARPQPPERLCAEAEAGSRRVRAGLDLGAAHGPPCLRGAPLQS